MVTKGNDAEGKNQSALPSAKRMKFGIVVAEWNGKITQTLYEGAYQALLDYECQEKNIVSSFVPGSIELTKGAGFLAEDEAMDAVICLGAVIEGETRHFDYVCQSVTYGITQLNLMYPIPFIFGVLTTKNEKQALDRAGGQYGNKGTEAAFTAIKMAALRKEGIHKRT